MDKCKLYVGGLSYSATSEDLKDTFSPYGEVTDTQIISDKFSGRSKGFGFVTMSTPEEAEAAVEALNETEMMGRKILVNIARPKEDRPADGGGFRRPFNNNGGGSRSGGGFNRDSRGGGSSGGFNRDRGSSRY